MPTPRLTPERLAANFADLHPPLTAQEARIEAARCLYCYDAPCTRSCPTTIDVPRFILQILHGNPAGSAETILSENILGGSCARACPTEVLCEGACVDRTLSGAPVEIGRLQRFATDYAAERGLSFFEAGPDTGREVAVIGSGPAGLACAHELRKLGHQVRVFEAGDLPGGLNTTGIAPYKITTEFALSEVEQALAIGFEIELNSPVDGPALKKLIDEMDAVFLGVGLGRTAPLDIPGEDAPGVWEALDFIDQAHRKPFEDCEVGERVVVIGGGNTAVDVATEAVRLGAKETTIAYRRTREAMPAFAYEYEIALADGVAFEWSARPVEFVSDGGDLRAVRFRRQRLEGDGRAARLVDVDGDDFEIPCDQVIKALGQLPRGELFAQIDGLEIDRGRVVIDPATRETSIPGLFSGGDCVSKGGEIVDAVQDGKLAARGIDQFLARKDASG